MEHKITKMVVGDQIRYPRLASEELNYVDPKDIRPGELPVGRISVDNAQTFGQLMQELIFDFSSVPAKFPIEWLDAIENISLVNPDVSQMVDNVVQLGNTGHKVIIEAKTEAQKDEMLEELNSFSASAFNRFGGCDGFVNALLAQIARGGANSVEWVLEEGFDGIEKAVLVPLSTIRFRLDKEADEYIPFQKVNDITFGKNGLIELNQNTYQYCAMQLVDSSPYAIPPVLAALESVMIQRDIIKNFRMVAKKMGLLGFVTFLMKAPMRLGGESDSTYLSRCRSFLQEQTEVLKHNYRDGVAVGFKDNFEVKSESLMGNAAGAGEIMKIMEEQVFSGLKSDPAMHGRTYSTTETYAGVVYEKMLSQLLNYQRTVKHILEYGYKLHLTMKGYIYDSLYVEFEPSKSLTAERDETTYNTKLQNLEWLYDQGIISQDQVAQEAGYEAPDQEEPRVSRNFNLTPDPSADTPKEDNTQSQSQLKFKFVWNRAVGRYSSAAPKKKKKPYTGMTWTQNEPLELSSLQLDAKFDEFWAEYLDGHEFGCSCEFHTESLALSASQKKLLAYIKKYFKQTYPNIKGSRVKAVAKLENFIKNLPLETMDSEDFATQVVDKLEKEFGIALNQSPLANNIRKSVLSFYKDFRLHDFEMFGGESPITPSLSQVDEQAQKFLRDSDEFYFGRYVKDPKTKKQLTKWLKDDFLESGRSLRDPGEMTAFRQRFGNRVGKEDYKVLRVVETSVSRAKNWGNVLTAEEAEVESIEILGPLDNLTCDWCQAMVGKEFRVDPVIRHVRHVMSQKPENLPQLSPFLPGRLTPAQTAATSTDQLLAQGIALPPYHPHCRHRFGVKTFKE